MKKSFNLLGLVAAVAIGIGLIGIGTELKARSTGTLYGDALIIGYPGTTVAAISEAGALTATGLTNVGALANTGVVTVSSVPTSSISMTMGGAVVTISTKNVTRGTLYYSTSDSKIYLATRTVSGENDANCISNTCYVALN